jgi:hypothetical protein
VPMGVVAVDSLKTLLTLFGRALSSALHHKRGHFRGDCSYSWKIYNFSLPSLSHLEEESEELEQA